MPCSLLSLPLVLAAAVLPAAAPADTTLAELRAALERRIAGVPGAEVGYAYVDLSTHDSLFIGADERFHAASTMKVPVMIELFRRVDQGGLALDQPVLLVNEFHSIVDGSPYALDPNDDSDRPMYDRVGERVPVRELIDHMIDRSSNLATNALIELVGADRVTATAHALGATGAQVLRGVEDGKAYAAGRNNTLTARDLAVLLAAIEQRRAVSPASSEAMKRILLGQEFNTEIPAGLPPGTPVAHKTGQITAHLHDAAIVYPAGRAPYVLVVLTRGIPDEHVAQKLIADLSRITYGYAMGAAGPR